MNVFSSSQCKKLLSALLLLTLIPLLPAQAYFSTETREGGSVTASELELSLGLAQTDGTIGAIQQSFSTQFGIEHVTNSSSTEVLISASSVGDGAFCGAIQLSLEHEGITTSDSINDFTYGPNEIPSELTLADIEFSIEPGNIGSISHGVGCDVTVEVFSRQLGTVGGFTDIQTLVWQLTAQQVVLNEVLPDPASGQVEFIELFNNGAVDVDVEGWIVTELTSGGATTSHVIASSSNTSSDLVAYDDSGSTLVPAGGHLALKFAGSASYLNNDGDTVALFDGSSNFLDSYTYFSSLDGKSDARIPDGVGNWIDPIPTPGGINKLEQTLVGLSIELSSGQSTTSSSSDADVDREATSGSGGSGSLEQVAVTVESEPQSVDVPMSDDIATTSVTATSSQTATSTPVEVEKTVSATTTPEAVVDVSTTTDKNHQVKESGASTSEMILEPEEPVSNEDSGETTNDTQEQTPSESPSEPADIQLDDEEPLKEPEAEVVEDESLKDPEPEPEPTNENEPVS